MFWQSNNLSGCWSFYDYGNDLYKIVQFKRLGNPTSVADSKKEKATEKGGRLAEQENKNNIEQLMEKGGFVCFAKFPSVCVDVFGLLYYLRFGLFFKLPSFF
jgi:hypothetical protein